MTYDPRITTGIPTEPVGSIPRPLKLQQAFADYDAKKITKAELEQEQIPSSVSKRLGRRSSPMASNASLAFPPIQSPIR